MRIGIACAALAAALLAVGIASAEQGVIRGTVASVTAVQGEDGTAYTLTVRGEGPWQAVLTVPAENRRTCEIARGLKPGERIAVAWNEGDGKLYVREISRMAEGERRDGERKEDEAREKPRAEGDRPKGDLERAEREAREGVKEKARRERDGEGRKDGPRDGDRPKEGTRDGEGERKGPRDGEVRKDGPRDGEGRKEGPRDGDRPKEGARDDDAPKDAAADDASE